MPSYPGDEVAAEAPGITGGGGLGSILGSIFGTGLIETGLEFYANKQQAKLDAKVAQAQAKAAASAARAAEAQAIAEAIKAQSAQKQASLAPNFGGVPGWVIPVVAAGLILGLLFKRE